MTSSSKSDSSITLKLVRTYSLSENLRVTPPFYVISVIEKVRELLSFKGESTLTGLLTSPSLSESLSLGISLVLLFEVSLSVLSIGLEI